MYLVKCKMNRLIMKSRSDMGEDLSFFLNLAPSLLWRALLHRSHMIQKLSVCGKDKEKWVEAIDESGMSFFEKNNMALFIPG